MHSSHQPLRSSHQLLRSSPIFACAKQNHKPALKKERKKFSTQVKDQVAAAVDALRVLVQCFDIPLFSHKLGPGTLIDALRRHPDVTPTGDHQG